MCNIKFTRRSVEGVRHTKVSISDSLEMKTAGAFGGVAAEHLAAAQTQTM